MRETKIEWCDHTWNPWWGCVKVSPGCANCYAEAFDRRTHGTSKHVTASGETREPHWGKDAPRRFFGDKHWAEPLRWDWEAAVAMNAAERGQAGGASGALPHRPRVFCASMADVFEDRPDLVEPRARLFRLIDATPNLDWLLLTKRPENIRRMVPPEWLESWPAHVWVGTTVEDQKRADQRIPHLLDVPARVRFLSVEPLLESVDLTAAVAELFCMKCRTPATIAASADPESTPEEDRAQWVDPECPHACPKCGGETDGRYPDDRIDWVIVGGESGTSAREFNLGWCRSIVDQCVASAVPVFVKQMGDTPRETVRDEVYDLDRSRTVKFRAHHGADPAEWPAELRRQSFPGLDR